MNMGWFVKNPVKVSMLFLGIVLTGILSLSRLPINLFPNIQTPRITLVVRTIGVTTQESERRLTADLERKLSSIKGVSGIISYTREDHILAHIDFHWNQDMDFAYLDVKRNIGTLEQNENIDSIDVYRFDPNADALMTLAFVGDIDRVQMTSMMENMLRAKIETIEGVAFVKINGGARQKVFVHTNDDVMAQYKITPEAIVNALRENNISNQGGIIREGNIEMPLKFISRIESLDDIRQCLVKMVENHPIHLEDLGEVFIGQTSDSVIVHQDGKQTVSVDIFREPDANAVATAKRVRERVNSLNEQGMLNLKIAVDQSTEIEAAIYGVVRTALIGMLLATIVLLVFLRNLIATVIVALAIPISIIATFSLMYFQGLSMNIMTLGGLALGAGMLVDNAIVVMENIFRHRQQDGTSASDSAITGTREVAGAILAATLTTVVVFVPLIYVHGIAGILFKDQALTVAYSLLMSLPVALILIPMLVARVRLSKAKNKVGIITKLYGWFLKISLKLRYFMPLIFVLLIYFTVQGALQIPSRFFPTAINGQMDLSLQLPLGTSINRTEAVVNKLEDVLGLLQYRKFKEADQNLHQLLLDYEQYIKDQNEIAFIKRVRQELTKMAGEQDNRSTFSQLVSVFELPAESKKERRTLIQQASEIFNPFMPYTMIESVTSTVGSEAGGIGLAGEEILGSHSAKMKIALNPAVLREISTEDVAQCLRDEVEKIPELSCTFEARGEFISNLLGQNRGDIVIEVHAEKLKDLEQSALAAANAFRQISGLSNVRTNLILAGENLILKSDRDAMNRGKFKTTDILKQVQSFLSGEQSEQFKLDQGEMSVSILNAQGDDKRFDDLLNLYVVSTEGKSEKLQNLVSIEKENSVREILRVNQERTLLVMADIKDVRYDEAIQIVRKKLDDLTWSSGTSWNISGEEVRRRESFGQLFFALIVAMILVYMVIASILESLIHPLTIMLSLPLALMGVVAAFLLLDISLNLMGCIGIVMLIGIVVNNAIVLLDRVRQLRDEGATPFDALVQAGCQRLRPIMMTSLTTILALLPLALGYESGAELRRPMAIAVIGGLASSTLLTLWMLPALYLFVEDILNLFRWIFRTVINLFSKLSGKVKTP